jgi:hypothetical protein
MTEPLDVHKIMAEHRTHLSSVDGSGRCVVGYPAKTTELCAPDHCLTYRLAEEHEGYPELADLMSDTLRKVANALNGPPPELTSWSWHNLPEKAQELVEKVAEQEIALTVERERVLRAAAHDVPLATYPGAIRDWLMGLADQQYEARASTKNAAQQPSQKTLDHFAAAKAQKSKYCICPPNLIGYVPGCPKHSEDLFEGL